MIFNLGPKEGEILIKIVLAAVIGFLIGLERREKHFGLASRTSMLICISACLFTIVGISVFSETNLSRVAQGLAAGIGFIGAAIIWKQKRERWIYGLTSAATIWALTAIGFAIGAGEYFLAVIVAAIILLILLVKRVGIE